MSKKEKNQWLRVSIKPQKHSLDTLIEQLSIMGTMGILETTDGVESYFPYQRRHNSIASIKKFLSSINEEDALVHYDIIEDEDWHLKWQDSFESIRITPDIVVSPPWESDPPSSRINIRIKPGMAFGTGTHESTQLILTLMENHIFPEASVLDAGCGSGILSIAAFHLGAQKIDSVEIDESAHENFLENIKLNDLEDVLNFRKQDITRLTSFPYDIVLANIQRNVILKLLKRIIDSKDRPLLLLSGLLNMDVPFIERSINNQYKIIDRANKGEWIALALEAT